MKSAFAIVAIVLAVAALCVVHFNAGAEGNVVVSGPVCCTVSPVSQASYGFSQQDAVTKTVFCDPVSSMYMCCFNEMSEELGSYVMVGGARMGACGSQNIFN